MDVVENGRFSAKIIQSYGSFKRFFSIQNYFDSSDDISFTNIKISAVKEYIPVLFLINIHMFFMKSTKATKQEKKTKRRKRWLFEEIISHYGNFVEYNFL
jgi:pimeloyl-CoA synthetase